MDKRKQANAKVKKKITDALIEILDSKDMNEVTITEIIDRAGVARMSFYRNYDSKESVLSILVDDVLEDYYSEIDWSNGDFYCYENIYNSFVYFERYREYVLNLCRFGFGEVLLKKLNEFHERVTGKMPGGNIEKYQVYMYMGALINTVLVWLFEENREASEDMAKMFYEYSKVLKPLGR